MSPAVMQRFDSTAFVAKLLAPIVATSIRADSRRTPARHAPASVRRTHFDPTHPDAIARPHADLRMLRADGLAVNEKLNVWMLTRHEHVDAAARRPEVFSSAQGIFLRSVDVPVMITRDRPDHTRLRRLTTPFFTPKRLAHLEGDVRRLSAPAIGRLAAGETVDLVESLAIPLPISMIAHLLGVPEEDWPEFRGWSDHLAQVFAPTGLRSLVMLAEDVFNSCVQIDALARREAALRVRTPGDDLFTVLQQALDAGEIDRLEMLLYVIILIVAGNETTTNLIGMLAQLLASDPELYGRVRADRSLVPSLVEETLRWGSPVQWVTRVTTESVEIDGVEIGANSRVLLHVASANRDPRKFADPDSLDIDRSTAGALSFGVGPHFCLGAHLARLEAITILNHLLDEVPALTPAGPVRWGTTPSLQGPVSVPVRAQR